MIKTKPIWSINMYSKIKQNGVVLNLIGSQRKHFDQVKPNNHDMYNITKCHINR